MKGIFALLAIIAMTAAFQVNTITNFPTIMYGGGSYSAFYSVDSGAIYPIYAYVNAPDEMNVRGCPNNICNISASNFNITVDLLPNIAPNTYNISVFFSANYTVPDATPSYADSNSGGGSVGGGYYVPKPARNESEEKLQNETDKEYQDILNSLKNKTNNTIKPSASSNQSGGRNTTWNVTSENTSEPGSTTVASLIGKKPDDNAFIVIGAIALAAIVAGAIFLFFRKPKVPEQPNVTLTE